MQLPKRGFLARANGDVVWVWHRPAVLEGETVESVLPLVVNPTTGASINNAEPGDFIVDLTSVLDDKEMADFHAYWRDIKCVKVGQQWEFHDKRQPGVKHLLNALLERARSLPSPP